MNPKKVEIVIPQGWRKLGKSETVKNGDMFAWPYGAYETWKECCDTVGKKVRDCSYINTFIRRVKKSKR